ncbi:diguanylate cyclase domain-containing protein [Paucibacter sp. Y2R2-4]|uniref:diguanylate cyclase domain-containing protein n=1 Tax=Paucibacter sp. Y2R2-4 TaxID=2893553 RepID=UPI0021E4127E|nr:diguanylate cyclase [Paucibacter sp. Y2R2-4]MCV2351277.1 diguanylate cyclase [Paucibacter sp. Y2R2-4]
MAVNVWLAAAVAALLMTAALTLWELLQTTPPWAQALQLLGLLLSLCALLGLTRQQARQLELAKSEKLLLHQRVLEAVNAMPAGFDLWDSEDRLVLHNQVLEQQFAALGPLLQDGARFEDLVRESLKLGLVKEAMGREQAWLDERLRGRKAAGASANQPILHRYGERWTHVYQTRVPSGDLVSVRMDVTDLIETQQELARVQAVALQNQRLLEQAIDAMPAGIEIFDAQDRLVKANRRMQAWQPHQDYAQAQGQSFEALLRASLAHGALPAEAIGREDEWVAQRLASRGQTHEPLLNQLPNGLWLQTYETRTPEGYLLAVHQDVSDLVAKEQQLKASQTELEAIIRTAAVAIFTIDAQGQILSCNPASERLFGYAPSELVGQNINLLMDEPERSHHDHYLRRYAERGMGTLRGRPTEFHALHKSGRSLTVQVAVSEVRKPDGPLFVGVISDLTERKQFETELQHANERLLRLSTTDALTELANRRLLMQKLEEEWRRGLRTGTPLSLLLVDVDHFKLFNDHYGHQAGDEALIKVAQALSTSANRPADLVARYGGEEFVLLLAQTDVEGAMAVAERCREELRSAAIEHVLSSHSEYLTLSIGMSSAVPVRGGSASQWLAQADLALYQAKAQGRDRVVLAQLFGPV